MLTHFNTHTCWQVYSKKYSYSSHSRFRTDYKVLIWRTCTKLHTVRTVFHSLLHFYSSPSCLHLIQIWRPRVDFSCIYWNFGLELNLITSKSRSNSNICIVQFYVWDLAFIDRLLWLDNWKNCSNNLFYQSMICFLERFLERTTLPFNWIYRQLLISRGIKTSKKVLNCVRVNRQISNFTQLICCVLVSTLSVNSIVLSWELSRKLF